MSKKEALVREILGRVADKSTLLVIDALEGKSEMRFSRLRERIGGVGQKMLTKTLRQLERDGLLTRRVPRRGPSARRLQADAARREPGTVRLQRVDVGGGTHAGCGTVQARLRYLRKTSIELAPEPDAKGGTVDC